MFVHMIVFMGKLFYFQHQIVKYHIAEKKNALKYMIV